MTVSKVVQGALNKVVTVMELYKAAVRILIDFFMQVTCKIFFVQIIIFIAKSQLKHLNNIKIE